MCVHFTIKTSRREPIDLERLKAVSDLFIYSLGRGEFALEPQRFCWCNFVANSQDTKFDMWQLDPYAQEALQKAAGFLSESAPMFRFTSTWYGDYVGTEIVVSDKTFMEIIRTNKLRNHTTYIVKRGKR